MSLGAIFVSLKQTNILREQQKIMASQQEGSVWPHLDVKVSVLQDSIYATFNMILKNSGIGPAITKNFKFNKDFQNVCDHKKLSEIIKSNKIDQVREISFEHPSGKTIPAGEGLSLILLKVEDPTNNYYKLFELLETFGDPQFCYESIYKTEYGEGCD